jgi:hypothetical protein
VGAQSECGMKRKQILEKRPSCCCRGKGENPAGNWKVVKKAAKRDSGWMDPRQSPSSASVCWTVKWVLRGASEVRRWCRVSHLPSCIAQLMLGGGQDIVTVTHVCTPLVGFAMSVQHLWFDFLVSDLLLSFLLFFFFLQY